MAATPPTVPTSHNGIRPLVPVLDMNNVPLSKNNKKDQPLFAKKKILNYKQEYKFLDSLQFFS
jgi:hypothetical protein